MTSENKVRPCISHHFACDCREAEFSEMKRERDDFKNALEKIVNDKSPPWDATDLKIIARQALLINEVDI